MADALANLEADDVLVIASCFPYTPSVLTTAEVVARRSITVFALTASAGSPLAKTARPSFFMANRNLFLSDSMRAFMLRAGGLLSAIASSLGKVSVEALRYRETPISKLNVSL